MKNFISKCLDYAEQNQTKLLTFGGIAGMWVTVGLVAHAAPIVASEIEKEKARINRERREAAAAAGYVTYQEVKRLSLIDAIRVSGKHCIAPLVTGIASTVCLFKADSINENHISSLTAACAMAEKGAKEYKEAVDRVVSDETKTEIRETVAKRQVEENPINEGNYREPPDIEYGSSQMFYEPLSGRYFRSSPERIQAAVNELNRQMRDDIRITVNEFYGEIGLSPIDLGSDIGWDIDDGYIDVYTLRQVTYDGMHCYVLSYAEPPKYLRRY